MYKTLRSTGALSYAKVEQMFEEHQGKWSEAIFNEDSWFKYIDPLVQDGSGAYLSMMQGSKAEQRKWWLYNRFRYIDSKYNAGDALSDLIQIRGYAKSDITVTPYADIYPTVKYGSYLVKERGHRGQPTTLECPMTTLNDTEIYIYSASQLASVGDLSGFKVGFADFSMATKLQEVKLGDSDSEYDNPNLSALTFGNNVLLKKIDIRNCSGLGDTSMQGHTQQAVDVSGCSIVEEIYFDGTKITGLTLPNGGVIKKLHLPGTITNLTIRNQTAITEFVVPSYANISTLRLENVSSAINSKAILNAIPAASRVRLIGFYWTATDADEIEDLLDLLDTMRGLDETGGNVDTAQVSGEIHTGSLTGAQIAELNARYPYVNVTADYVTSYLRYYNYNSTSGTYDTLMDTVTCLNGVPERAYGGSTPTRAETAAHTFTFNGWSKSQNATTPDADAETNVIADRDIYASYAVTGQTYTVRFYNGATLLETHNNVPYGSNVQYGGSTPVHPSDPDNYQFNGWQPTGQNITGNTNCYAQWTYMGSFTREIIKRTISGVYENTLAAVAGDYAFYGCSALTNVSLPNVTSIGSYTFQNCLHLESVNLPNATSIDSYAFNSCSALTTVILRANQVATLANTNAFTGANNAIIYVPDSLVDSYKAATNWSTYTSRIKGISELPE